MKRRCLNPVFDTADNHLFNTLDTGNHNAVANIQHKSEATATALVSARATSATTATTTATSSASSSSLDQIINGLDKMIITKVIEDWPSTEAGEASPMTLIANAKDMISSLNDRVEGLLKKVAMMETMAMSLQSANFKLRQENAELRQGSSGGLIKQLETLRSEKMALQKENRNLENAKLDAERKRSNTQAQMDKLEEEKKILE